MLGHVWGGVLRVQQFATVDDGVGIIEPSIAHLFALVAVVPHVQVQGFIASVNKLQEFAVAFAGSLLIFRYGGTAFPFPHP